jgi:hypothetical protein
MTTAVYAFCRVLPLSKVLIQEYLGISNIWTGRHGKLQSGRMLLHLATACLGPAYLGRLRRTHGLNIIPPMEAKGLTG